MSFMSEKEASLMKDISLLKQKSNDKDAFGKQLMRFSRDHLEFLSPDQRKNVQSVAVLCQYKKIIRDVYFCLLYTSPSPRDATLSRMPSSA